MKLTVPTWLTLLRIVMIPVLIVVFYLPYQWSNIVATGVFAIAAITDWLDGWIARRYAQHSLLGAFLRPSCGQIDGGHRIISHCARSPDTVDGILGSSDRQS